MYTFSSFPTPIVTVVVSFPWDFKIPSMFLSLACYRNPTTCILYLNSMILADSRSKQKQSKLLQHLRIWVCDYYMLLLIFSTVLPISYHIFICLPVVYVLRCWLSFFPHHLHHYTLLSTHSQTASQPRTHRSLSVQHSCFFFSDFTPFSFASTQK